MLTYQDLLEVGERDEYKMEFVRKVINDHKSSELYKTAVIAWDYYKHRNTTITNYQKLLYTVTGKAVPDNISANFKISPDFSNVDMDGAIATFSALINASLFVPEALIYVPLSTLNLLKTVFVNSNSTLVSVDDKAILLILNPSEIL
jgi:hypothetical protein